MFSEPTFNIESFVFDPCTVAGYEGTTNLKLTGKQYSPGPSFASDTVTTDDGGLILLFAHSVGTRTHEPNIFASHSSSLLTRMSTTLQFRQRNLGADAREAFLDPQCPGRRHYQIPSYSRSMVIRLPEPRGRCDCQ